MIASFNCPLCENTNYTEIDQTYLSCDGCKAIVMKEECRLNSSEEKARYDAHHNNIDDPGYRQFTSPIWSWVMQHFNKSTVGLDYGCGPGPVISSILKNEGYDIKLYDPFYQDDKSIFKKKYDYVFSCEAFEHFNQPKAEIEKILPLIEKGGYLLIMTLLYHQGIKFNNWFYRRDKTHVFIYSKETILFIAKQYQMDIIELSDRFIVFQKNYD
ncbi:MAG: class I SAM-dependent methyltransferase [Cyclobacteriaceae bacterium]|nr:class I SAM-dependent methyltransferase [Cyclobacteriaceae bacterium]MCH8514742.1 class I SAM-dependent methyltransferase [Cyclobacteriaceae bacterium]